MGGERDIDVTEKHQSVISHTLPSQESNRQPRYVPGLGLNPQPFCLREMLQPVEPPGRGLITPDLNHTHCPHADPPPPSWGQQQTEQVKET